MFVLKNFDIQYMKRISLFLFSLICSLSLWAVIATPTPFTVQQADGTTVQIVLHGDEHFSYRTTIDNYFVAKDNNGTYRYVNYMPDGTYAMTSVIAHNPDRRSITEKAFVSTLSTDQPFATAADRRRRIAQQAHLSRSYPRTGSPKSIVILVNFTDVKFKHTREEFDRLCNESGYHENHNQGSCRDFFIAQSDSIFQPIFDVYGPYELDHNQQYYGGNVGSNNSQRAADMIIEACSKAKAAGVDFTQYNCDGDSSIDNVYVFYAGHGEADTPGAEDAVWPHRSVVSSAITYDGLLLHDYACSSELRGEGGMATIGTFCHEFGHVLGLPDYYDTADDAAITVGSWDIMCSGSYNGRSGYSGSTPPSYSAHSKWWLGWKTNMVQLTTPSIYLLEPVENKNSTCYIIAPDKHSMNPMAAEEFFILENRQYVGWDDSEYKTSFPNTGLLVWHINYIPSAWAGNLPNSGGALNYFIESAYGGTRTRGSRNDTYPQNGRRTEFNPTLKDGTNLFQPIYDIREIDNNISFIYKSESENAFTVYPMQLEPFKSDYDTERGTYKFIDYKEMYISGDSIDPQVPIEIVCSSSEILFATELNADSKPIWKLTSPSFKANSDSTLNQIVYVGFSPGKMYCPAEPFSTVLTVKQGNNQQILSLSGVSSREVKVSTPESVELRQVTPYTASLQWDMVEDASKYYFTLYQMQDGESLFTQSFENFDDEESISLAGWETNFVRTTGTFYSDGRKSLHFLNTGDYVLSERYIQPITGISFFYQSFNVSGIDTIGYFMLEGLVDEKWDTLRTMIPMKSSNKGTFKYDLESGNPYVQFRLTYFAHTNSRGTAIDAFTAMCNKQIDYIYTATVADLDLTDIAAGDKVALKIGNLQPDADYYFQVQASDEGQGGCSTTITKASEPLLFHTLEGKVGDKDLTYSVDSLSYDRVQRVIFIPQVEEGGTLFFFDASGHLVASVDVQPNQNAVPFPDVNFIERQWYLIQFAPNDKLKRKNRQIKILY